MKTLILCASLAAISCTGILGTPCVPGNFQTFIDLGAAGCGLSTVQFTDFSMLPGLSVGTPLEPVQLHVTPGGSPSNPTLLLTLDRTATAGQTFESLVRFSVSDSLSGASIGLTTPMVSGDGAVTGLLDLCPNDSFAIDAPVNCPTRPASLMVFAIDTSSLLSDSAHFPVSKSVDVFVDLTIDGGRSGSATLDSATVGFSSGSSAVPEPSAGLLVALGLSPIALSRVRQSWSSAGSGATTRSNSLLGPRFADDAGSRLGRPSTPGASHGAPIQG